ncbi:hypothetical protein [Actinoplanes sp. G11-F43]|uniref:hypothetical protein n=1 Tax=Actinoplanes sp. G11-F43 TaxID=3424130 RepID=UPI003D35331B
MSEMVGKIRKWFAAAMAGLTLGLLVPAQAWASEPVLEAARRSGRGFGFFGFAALCCLFVVAGVVLAVVLISRGRKRR